MTPHILTRSLNKSATVFLLIVAAVGILVPLSNLLLPASSPFQVPTYLMALFGKYLCYALLAISVDLLWGYTGLLSLGQALGLCVRSAIRERVDGCALRIALALGQCVSMNRDKKRRHVVAGDLHAIAERNEGVVIAGEHHLEALRFDAVISNLMVSVENQSASRSRILDADYATETANLSRSQILQQAGTAMVAQANQLPQGVLALLR